jgi:hypothetical protein
MTLQEASTTVDEPRGAVRRTAAAAWDATVTWGQELLGAPAVAGRALSPARASRVKYDEDVLHITLQYPGCDDERMLGILRTRVSWFGRGTSIHKIFSPSLRTVHAAGRRLESTGKIKTKVEPSDDRQVLRFYPNNPVWADVAPKDLSLQELTRVD